MSLVHVLKIIHFYQFDSDPRFPPFLLYVIVRWKSGVTFVRRCSVMNVCVLFIFRTLILHHADPESERKGMVRGLSIKYVDFPYNSGSFQYFKTKVW